MEGDILEHVIAAEGLLNICHFQYAHFSPSSDFIIAHTLLDSAHYKADQGVEYIVEYARDNERHKARLRIRYLLADCKHFLIRNGKCY